MKQWMISIIDLQASAFRLALFLQRSGKVFGINLDGRTFIVHDTVDPAEEFRILRADEKLGRQHAAVVVSGFGIVLEKLFEVCALGVAQEGLGTSAS